MLKWALILFLVLISEIIPVSWLCPLALIDILTHILSISLDFVSVFLVPSVFHVRALLGWNVTLHAVIVFVPMLVLYPDARHAMLSVFHGDVQDFLHTIRVAWREIHLCFLCAFFYHARVDNPDF